MKKALALSYPLSAQQRLWSDWADAQADLSSLGAQSPPSLIRVFAVRMKKALALSYPLSAQQRLWSDWADAQADLSSLGAQSLCCFCHVAAHLIVNKWRHNQLPITPSVLRLVHRYSQTQFICQLYFLVHWIMTRTAIKITDIMILCIMFSAALLW